MEYRLLGRSGLKVSLYSLGTMNFAGEGFFGKIGSLSMKDAARLVDIAVDQGVNLLDTSNAYTTGKSEEAVGEILKGRSNQILVGTKVRFAMGQGPNEQGLSRFHIVEQCEASLKRLKRDRIDIYYLHEWDGLTPVEEMMEALDTLVRQGKIRYAACSNFSGWHIMKCLMAAERHNFQRFVAQQIHYTIEARERRERAAPDRPRPGRGRSGVEPDRGRAAVGQVPPQFPPPDVSRHTSGWGEPPIRDEERLYDHRRCAGEDRRGARRLGGAGGAGLGRRRGPASPTSSSARAPRRSSRTIWPPAPLVLIGRGTAALEDVSLLPLRLSLLAPVRVRRQPAGTRRHGAARAARGAEQADLVMRR